jgi:hypothetical protein
MGTSFPLLKQLMQKQMQNVPHGPATRQRAIRKAVIIWAMMAFSTIFVANQIRTTKKVARLTSTKEPSSFFLPDWGIQHSASGLLPSWLWKLEEDEDEASSLDGDDNVFEDDDDVELGKDGSDEEIKEGSDIEETLKNLNDKVKALRIQLQEYANLNPGKIEPKLMKEYRKIVRYKRKLMKTKRQGKENYVAVASRSQKDAAYLAEKYEKSYIRPNSTRYEGDSNDEELQVQREAASGERLRRYRHRSEASGWEPPGKNTTDYTKFPILPMEDRVLPHMSESGGVVFFLHIPKTVSGINRLHNAVFIAGHHADSCAACDIQNREVKRFDN